MKFCFLVVAFSLSCKADRRVLSIGSFCFTDRDCIEGLQCGTRTTRLPDGGQLETGECHQSCSEPTDPECPEGFECMLVDDSPISLSKGFGYCRLRRHSLPKSR
jgi:hypothetical protein